MCLIVEDIPYSITDGLVVQCRKSLNHDPFSPFSYALVYHTSFQDAPVPKDGLLLPTRPGLVEPSYYDKTITAGFIHAYIIPEEDVFGVVRHNWYKAIAFGVVGYGAMEKTFSANCCGLGDLACRALYIPFLDKTKRTETRQAAVDSALNANTIANKMKHLLAFDKRMSKILKGFLNSSQKPTEISDNLR